MEYQEFSAMYNVLKSTSSDNDLSKDDVIKAIKGQLSQDSDEYKKWEEGNFSLDHVFTTVNDHKVESKHTLLTTACKHPDLEVVEFLINIGASVNVAIEDETPLTIAIEKECGDSQHQGLVDLLMKANIDVNAADKKGVDNTMIKAVERGNLRVFKYLVAKGASLDIRAPSGTLLQWAEMHKSDPQIKEEDMDEIINIIKAPSEEKKQTDPEIATSTNIDNLKQTGEAESTIPTVPDETSGEISLEERDAEYALECQIEEIALSTDGQLPENNDINFTDAQGVTTTPANSSEISPAPTTDSKTPEKNDTTFWSEHKGKIALGVTGLCVAGAVAAYVLAYPAVALALAVLAAVILMGAGIAKVLEDPSVEKQFIPQQEVH
ncbi:ANK_REP_REGION domain-containing protein [Trichonephila clavata]|uniref:Alpha-latrotoxin n=1 Tax=Trichonephila clavata TaxID=2740835 RepID=A0A8X6L820_TRICU|nr:ANK_REP_REGION domain-containing protein [Trichonephila clavata]